MQKLSEEVRWRVALVLAVKSTNDREQRLKSNARRVLATIGTQEAKAFLERLMP